MITGPAGYPVIPSDLASYLYLAAKAQGYHIYVGLDAQFVKDGNVCPTCWVGDFLPMDKDNLREAVLAVWQDLGQWGYERIEICSAPTGAARNQAIMVRANGRDDA